MTRFSPTLPLDRRSDILAEKRDDAPVDGSSQSIDTGESGDQAVIELETRNQRSFRPERALR